MLLAAVTTGIAVVHGVGDPDRGDTVNEVVERLCGRHPSLSLEASGRRVLAAPDLDPEVVVPQRRLVDTASNRTLLLSEVFWGDIGRVTAGWGGLLTALGSLAMGLHALIFAGGGILDGTGAESATSRPHLPRFRAENRWLRATFWTAFVGAYHIKGVLMPLAGLILLLAAWSLVVSAGPPTAWVLVSPPIAGLLALRLPAPGSRRPNDTADESGSKADGPDRWVKPTVAFGFWCVVGYVVPVCCLLLSRGWLQSGHGWLVGLLFSLAFGTCHTLVILHTNRRDWRHGGKRAVALAAVWLAAIPWLWLVFQVWRDGGASGMVAGLGPLLASAYHVALGLAAAWVLVVGGLHGVNLVAAKTDVERARSKVIFVGYALECGLLIAIATGVGALASQMPGGQHLAWLDSAAYGPRTWLQLTAVVFPISLACTLAVWWWITCSKRKAQPFEIAQLLGSWPLSVVTAATAIACAAAVAEAIGALPLGAPPRHLAAVAAATLPLLGLLRWLQEPLHQGLDLATDITLYFRGRSWASSVHHRADQILRRRFTAVLDDLVDTGASRIVVVAHSQGTVVATDALRDWKPARPDVVVDLLTMGSPLQSLYVRFFPVQFGKIVPEVLDRVRSWTNLSRHDDYVGRSLDGDVKNQEIAGTGHTGYWTDTSVLESLEELLGLPKPPKRV